MFKVTTNLHTGNSSKPHLAVRSSVTDVCKYLRTNTSPSEIDYMCPGQSIFFTEVSFSARWGSPADITLTVCKKKKVFPQTNLILAMSEL